MAKHHIIPITYRDGTLIYFDTRGWITLKINADKIYPNVDLVSGELEFAVRPDLQVKLSALISITLGVVIQKARAGHR